MPGPKRRSRLRGSPSEQPDRPIRRVLVQINSLALGGTQLNAVDMARAMREHGYESILVGPRDTVPGGTSLFDVADEKGVPLEAFTRPRSTLRGAFDMYRLARRHQADLVHVYGSWTSRPALWGACTFGRRPLVLTIYEMAVDDSTLASPSLIVGTEYLHEELESRPSGVELISPPVDVDHDDSAVVDAGDFLRQHGLDVENRRVVMVTRLDEEMKALGVQQAIAVMATFAASGVDLVIVGAGDAEARLRRQADALNAELGRTAVVFTGPAADPRAAYAAADVVIGMGGSAARALSFGKPLVVAGENGWFRTFAPETSAALFRNSFWSDEVMEDAVCALEDCLAPLLDDAGLREDLGRFGRAFAVSNFSLDAMAARLAGVYDSSLGTYGWRTWRRDLPGEFRRLTRFLGRLQGAAPHNAPTAGSTRSVAA